MKPIPFTKSNLTLKAPPGIDPETCLDLPVFANGQFCCSCWQLEPGDLERIQETGVVWLTVWAGQSQPPVCVEAESDVLARLRQDDDPPGKIYIATIGKIPPVKP